MIFLRKWISLAVLCCASALALAEDIPQLTAGQTLYLPIYSFLWHGNIAKGGVPSRTPISTLVSIRNTDPKQSIRLVSARYYDTVGNLLSEYVATPRIIGAMGTSELYIEKQETAGGSGANFLIVWQAESPVNPPVVEAVHADIQGNRTLAFVTVARPVHPTRTK